MDLHYLTLLFGASALRSGEVSPVALTQMMPARIEALDSQLYAYALVTPEHALAQAARAEAEIAQGEYRGVLQGIPIAVEDIFYTAAITTAAGMPLHKEHVPAFDATVVQRLSQTGAVLLGKLQLTEGAFVTHHPDVTPPRNPWNPGYYAGTSSSESRVAAAASPTITLPGGLMAKGLARSFRLVARHLDEISLVRAGHAYQQLTDWHEQHPSL